MNKTVAKARLSSIKALFLFIAGGIGYYLIEILYRGHSHWTMAVCGGACLVGIYCINKKFRHFSLAVRALMGTALVTAIEFTVGCIVNIWLKWNVWSYQGLPLNFMGQISLLFSCYWFFLSFAACWVISAIEKGSTKKELSKTAP